MAFMRTTRPLFDIIPDVLAQAAALFRKERQLAAAEIAGTTRRFAIGLGLVVAGGVLLVPALFILLMGGVAALVANGFAIYWAALIVAAGVFLVSAALVMIGLGRLKTKDGMFRATASQLHADAALVKRQLRRGDAFDTAA
jgi:hypothetical protein